MSVDEVNAAGFADAPCVRYYRTIRAGVPGSSSQLGYGVNKRPAAPAVVDGLGRIHAEVLAHRAIDYDDGGVGIRALIGRLVGRYLGVPAPGPEQITLFQGGTEAISYAAEYAAQRRLRPVLPLPNYYSFEHSLARYGAPAPVFYSADGCRTGPLRPGRRLVVDVAPNGVLGTWFTLPDQVQRAGDLLLVDVPFSLPLLVSAGRFRSALRRRLAGRQPWLLCMTPSKDLSIPGLRVGFVAATEAPFPAFANAVRFERGYSVHAGVGLIAALHLALVLIAAAPAGQLRRVTTSVRADFAGHQVPFLNDPQVECFLADLTAAGADFATNLTQLDGCGLFTPVAGADRPVAGYSTFRWLRRPFRSANAFTAWINQVGRDGLKLNPNYLFSGAPESWQRLYPDGYGIRLNLSVPPPQLREDLRLLAQAVTATYQETP